MAEVKDLSVIITNDSVDVSSRLGSVLDSSGFKVLIKNITSREELGEELRNAQIDIILAHQDFTTPSAAEVLQDLNRLNRDVPVIIIATEPNGADAANGIRVGARDVVGIDEDQHLIAVINRELKNRADRSKHRDTLRRFYASENRYQQLLQYARLPMAIIHESMFVLVNDAFSDLFDIDKEEADALPIVDILDKEAQASYKEILKKFTSSPDSFPGAEIITSITNETGQKTNVKIDLNTVQYNDENCLQLKIEPQLGSTSAQKAAASSGPTAPRNKLVQHIESCISIAHSNKKDSSLLCLEIDAFDKLQETLGIAAFDDLYTNFIEFVCENFPERIISVFDNNKLMVLLEEVDAQTALKQAGELAKKVDNKVFEFGENSQQITITAGIALISDLSTNADTVVKQSIRACEQFLANKENGIGNGAHLYEPEKTGDDSDVDINFLLKQAFKHKHLQILFQPMMKFHGNASKNYEVLLGIRPEHKETYPKDFIAMATRNNENDEIDRWVILEAMKTLLKKQDCEGSENLYIHISKQSIQNPKFSAWVGAAIKKSRLSPKQLSFQLREIDVSTSLNAAASFIKAVKSFGCATVITHFGSSVQPMKILEQIPFDFAKIDGSFTLAAQKGESENMSKILEQVAERNVKAIVPMVESATIMPVLWKSNVAYIQGYYVRAPGDKMDYSF
ncbi:MAG: EAL domain-containing protein [Porticoccaceae bacterium]